MPTYVFDKNFRIVGVAGDVPPDQGTIDTAAVTLSEIVKVNPVTGKTITFEEHPQLFTVQDLPQNLVSPAFTTPLTKESTTFPQKIRVTKLANQSLVSAADTQIVWDVISLGIQRVGLHFAAGVLQTLLPGTYMISATCLMSSDANITASQISIVTTRSTNTFKYPDTLTSGLSRSLHGVAIVDLQVNDVISVKVQCTSAGAITMSATNSWLEVVQIHPG